MAPPQDAQQDWMLSYFSEEQNVTTLKFYRKRDTNDTANDIAIQVTLLRRDNAILLYGKTIL